MGNKMRLTKKEAYGIFMDQFRENKPKYKGKIDRVAMFESWNNFTDSLHRDNLITDNQVKTWTNPFSK